MTETGRAAGGPTQRLAHLGVTLGLSVGVYGASLAAVTWLQSRQASRATAEAAPAATLLAALSAHDDALAPSLGAGTAKLDVLLDGYRAEEGTLAALEARLRQLGATVGAVAGAVPAPLPARAALPQVAGVSAAAAGAPATHATTGASGAP